MAPKHYIRCLDDFRPLVTKLLFESRAEVFARATLARLLERSAGIEVHDYVQFFEPEVEAAIG